MRNLIWAGTFLVLTLVASTVAAAAMLGMPIAGGVQFAVAGVAILLLGWGIVLLATTPIALRLKPATVSNDQRCFPQDDRRRLV